MSNRTWLACTLGVVALAGCPDTGSAPDARLRFDAGPPPSIDAEVPTIDAPAPPPIDAEVPVIDAEVPTIDAEVPTIDAAPTMAPVIAMVAWTHTPTCTPGTPSAVTVTITATDGDTAAAMLTFAGSFAGCTGTIDSNPDTITCPQLAPYSGSVTVTDPEGNSATRSGLSISPCVNGSSP